jgi:hypothetical protein
MSVTIKLRRGQKSQLPTEAALGEALLTLDTKELYFGMGAGVPVRKVGGEIKVEDVTGHIDGTLVDFPTQHEYVPGSLRVTYNGARLRKLGVQPEFEETSPTGKTFRVLLPSAPKVPDWMEIEYEKAV